MISGDAFKAYCGGCEKDIHLWEQIPEVTSGLEIKLPMPCKIICRVCRKESKGLYYPSLGNGFGELIEDSDE